MDRLTSFGSRNIFALVCLGVFLACKSAASVEKQPISPQELRTTQEPLIAQVLEADQRLRELEIRAQEVMEEVKSPDRNRSLDEIREELAAILKEPCWPRSSHASRYESSATR